MVLQFLNFNPGFFVSDSGNLFHSWILVMLTVASICFIVGELTQNYSQVDKVWSLMPIVYSWMTLIAFPTSPRLWIMTLLVTLWGFRLSYNFYRKGGYNKLPWKGEEDYRWSFVRQHPLLNAKWKKTLFNFFFISIYQHVLILLFSSPLLLVSTYSMVKLSWLDYLAAFFMLIFIGIETIADNQQYNFQLQKQNKMPRNGKFINSLTKGFMIDGHWKYVRHPNFAAEQAIWVSFYFFGVAASAQWLNQTVTGSVLLILLFIGSSEMTERISMSKYPDYMSYKQKIPKFIPLFNKKENKPSK